MMSFIAESLRVLSVTDFPYGNATLKQIVSKLSYFKNWTAYFVETYTVYVQ